MLSRAYCGMPPDSDYSRLDRTSGDRPPDRPAGALRSDVAEVGRCPAGQSGYSWSKSLDNHARRQD